MEFKIAVANEKGGVGKTVTAVSLAYAFHHLTSRPLTLVDADEHTRSATRWLERGHGAPMRVLDLDTYLSDPPEGITIMDTKASEGVKEIVTLAGWADLLIVPTKPDALSMSALMLTLEALSAAKIEHYRVLLTDVPPAPSTNGFEARVSLMKAGYPVFAQDIRRASAVEKAALEGISLKEVKKDQRAKLAWMDYELVAREVIRDWKI